MGEVIVYDWSVLEPPPERLVGVDTTSPLGRLLAEWTENNRRAGREYDRRRRALVRAQKAEGTWHEADHEAGSSRASSGTASTTRRTASTESGAGGLTRPGSPD